MNETKNYRNPDSMRLNVYIPKHLMRRLDNMSGITNRDKSDLVREALLAYVGSFEREQKNQP